MVRADAAVHTVSQAFCKCTARLNCAFRLVKVLKNSFALTLMQCALALGELICACLQVSLSEFQSPGLSQRFTGRSEAWQTLKSTYVLYRAHDPMDGPMHLHQK